MIKTITNAGFVSKSGAKFDVVMEDIKVSGDGFLIIFTKKFKNSDGTPSDDIEDKHDSIFISKSDKANLYNNVTGDMETKIINKFTT